MENTSAASQELARMHALSIASAIAITRLLPQLSAAEVGRLVEHARLALALQSTDLIAAMMFAQPLLAKWDDWTLAYLIGVSLGIKLTTDGFYLSDIITNVTAQFPLQLLRRAECAAVCLVSWTNIEQCFLSFRNALISVAFDYLPSGLFVPVGGISAAQPVSGVEDYSPNVLIVHRGGASRLTEQMLEIIPSTSITAFNWCVLPPLRIVWPRRCTPILLWNTPYTLNLVLSPAASRKHNSI